MSGLSRGEVHSGHQSRVARTTLTKGLASSACSRQRRGDCRSLARSRGCICGKRPELHADGGAVLGLRAKCCLQMAVQRPSRTSRKGRRIRGLGATGSEALEQKTRVQRYRSDERLNKRSRGDRTIRHHEGLTTPSCFKMWRTGFKTPTSSFGMDWRTRGCDFS